MERMKRDRQGFCETHEPAATNHFRIIGASGPGYRVAPHSTDEGWVFPHLGWSFHTTSELEYLLVVLIKELNDLMRQVECNPNSGVLENRRSPRTTFIPAPVEPRIRTGLGLRFSILKRDGYRCQICGRDVQEDGIKLEVDHRIPRARGGTDDPENLWTLCFDCNRGKRISDL